MISVLGIALSKSICRYNTQWLQFVFFTLDQSVERVDVPVRMKEIVLCAVPYLFLESY